jgi:myo-inositol 2-dehydrogenase/D-chiro-inositol 1-dehydrogenase
MKKPIKIGILGLGRIGQLHTRNIGVMPDYEIVAGVDAYLTPEKEKMAKELGVRFVSTNPDDIFMNPDIEAVAIFSTTDTHSDFIMRAARSKKAAFCEKPIDNNVDRILEALRTVKEEGTKLMIGFSRRFDKHHAKLQKLVASGKIGDVNMIKITSRDPAPPTYEYVASSGGIYVDMMIHDFDMARFVVGSEVTEVYATGAVLCDPLFEKANDVDTAIVTLKFENGALGVIDNSRRSGFGHDQRIEVLGSKGCLMDQNQTETNVLYFNEEGVHGEPVQYFFLERYNDAFINELKQFAQVVRGEIEIPVTGFDGLQAVLIAEAAARSAASGKAEKVERIQI